MFLIKYTFDSTRTDYTKKCGNKLLPKSHIRIADCTKKATTKEIKTNSSYL